LTQIEYRGKEADQDMGEDQQPAIEGCPFVYQPAPVWFSVHVNEVDPQGIRSTGPVAEV
jgi:hypothetical protein